MSEQDLQELASTFEEMPAELVESPSMPVENVLQEANDLFVLLAEDKPIRQRLLTVGLPEVHIASLRTAIGALQLAQSQWVIVRSGKKSKEQTRLEDTASAHKLDVLAACRWNLRNDERALATVSTITEGDGVADLIQDLNDLATLMNSRREAFADDASFDVETAIAQARQFANAVQKGTSEGRAERAKTEAKDLRDKAYTHLSELVDTVRGAGRYAFRGDEKTLASFQSRYLRRLRSRSRSRGDDESPVPVPKSAN